MRRCSIRYIKFIHTLCNMYCLSTQGLLTTCWAVIRIMTTELNILSTKCTVNTTKALWCCDLYKYTKGMCCGGGLQSYFREWADSCDELDCCNNCSSKQARRGPSALHTSTHSWAKESFIATRHSDGSYLSARRLASHWAADTHCSSCSFCTQGDPEQQAVQASYSRGTYACSIVSGETVVSWEHMQKAWSFGIIQLTLYM